MGPGAGCCGGLGASAAAGFGCAGGVAGTPVKPAACFDCSNNVRTSTSCVLMSADARAAGAFVSLFAAADAGMAGDGGGAGAGCRPGVAAGAGGGLGGAHGDGGGAGGGVWGTPWGAPPPPPA